ncbi:MAG: S8 family serine peptidase, partial [Acidimicrobiia bacterium]
MHAFSVDRSNLSRLATALLTAALAMSVLFLPPKAASSDETARFIVQQTANAGEMPEVYVEQLGGTVVEQVSLIDGFIADLPVGAATALQSHPEVASVTPDSSVQFLEAASDSVGIWETASAYTDPFYSKGALNRVSRQIDADDAWQYGYAGDGIGVALIDSGVAPVAGLSSSGKLINGPDLSFESQSDELRYVDTFGHGTHLAGIIAGRDKVDDDEYDEAAEEGDFIGVAPDATLISIKTANFDGATDVSQVIAAIDWVVQHRNDNGMNIRVLNLSFGTDGVQDYLLDPLAFAVEQAWKAGIVVVVAAGNDGNQSLLRNPASDPYVIAVGAADGNGVADFSSCGTKERHVDLVAPGKSIISLRNPGSNADT